MKIEIDIPDDQMEEMHATFIWNGKFVRIRLTESGVDYLREHPEFLAVQVLKAYEGSDDAICDE